MPQQASGELGPKRHGERPHIIKCPGSGEVVLYAHAASDDYQTDKKVVYATSATISMPTYLETWMLDVGAGTWSK